MTKYAEWITQPCGRCRILVDIGSITKDDIDPDCPDHRQFRCIVCGDMVDVGTIAHGTLGGDIHRPKEGR